MHELNPCPFCGGAASLALCGFGTAKVVCMDCGSEGSYSTTSEEAIAAWNRRTPPNRADAWVPIHPRNGPLWAMTTNKPDAERLPGSYPLRPVVFADLIPEGCTPALIGAADKHADDYEGQAIPAQDVRAAITNAFYAGARWKAEGCTPAEAKEDQRG